MVVPNLFFHIENALFEFFVIIPMLYKYPQKQLYRILNETIIISFKYITNIYMHAVCMSDHIR